MRVCDFIARHFQQIGISKVFGFQGGAITPLIDALALNGISYIQGYHEQAAGFMADCNARLTHQCAVAMATNGPGLTNLVTAVANAYLDSVPVLFLTGQVNPAPRSDPRRGRSQAAGRPAWDFGRSACSRP